MRNGTPFWSTRYRPFADTCSGNTVVPLAYAHAQSSKARKIAAARLSPAPPGRGVGVRTGYTCIRIFGTEPSSAPDFVEVGPPSPGRSRRSVPIVCFFWFEHDYSLTNPAGRRAPDPFLRFAAGPAKWGGTSPFLRARDLETGSWDEFRAPRRIANKLWS